MGERDDHFGSNKPGPGRRADGELADEQLRRAQAGRPERTLGNETTRPVVALARPRAVDACGGCRGDQGQEGLALLVPEPAPGPLQALPQLPDPDPAQEAAPGLSASV